jgi:hypothetical protein
MASAKLKHPDRVPDAVQRSRGDANGSRECAPDDRLRIVRYAAPQSRDPFFAARWTPDQQRTTPQRM